MLRQLRSVRESLDADCAATIKELPKLCVKIVLIADWSVAHFVVIDDDNEMGHRSVSYQDAFSRIIQATPLC